MMMAEQPMAFGAWIKRYVGEQDATKMRFSVEELRIAFDAGVSTPKPADALAVVEERMLPDDAVERAREVLERLDGHGFQNEAEFEAALFTGKQFVAAMLAFATHKPADPTSIECTCQRHPTHCANDCPTHGLDGESYTAGEPNHAADPTSVVGERMPDDAVDRAAVAIAKVLGIDLHEQCGAGDDDDGTCDSATCPGALTEDHDTDEHRERIYRMARAALATNAPDAAKREGL